MIDVSSVVINLNGFPEDEAEDIRRCLETLYTVRTGEQPLDREFGIDNSFLDQPINIAKNLFTLEVIEKTKRYEKRVEVEEVEYRFNGAGQMAPVIFLKRSGVS
ncbi:MAG: GPW/gp25 family protein [Lachnospiraceae bacterium]|jgi:phage baseplate assembly protein W|nr:GPW/gp25 family protein [Lachnospiraceae bacterium]